MRAGEGAVGEDGGLVHPADDLGEAVAAVWKRGAAAAGDESEQADGVEREEEAQGVVAGQVCGDAHNGLVVVVLGPEAPACENREGDRCQADEGQDGGLEVLVFHGRERDREREAACIVDKKGGFGRGAAGRGQRDVGLQDAKRVVEGEEGEEEEMADQRGDEGVEEVGG